MNSLAIIYDIFTFFRKGIMYFNRSILVHTDEQFLSDQTEKYKFESVC